MATRKARIREAVMSAVSDLVTDFVFYDRKESENLSMDDLNEAVEKRWVTVDEMVAKFRKSLEATYPTKEKS